MNIAPTVTTDTPATTPAAQALSDREGQALLERFVLGDERALDDLLGAYSAMVFGILVGRFRLAPEDADDLYQEILLQLVTKATSIRDVRPWLVGTAFNQARKRIRRLVRDRDLAERCRPEIEETVEGGIDEVRDLVERGLATLAERDREMLQLIYMEELSYSEVAERLGRPIGSIGPVRGRALKRLRKNLEHLEARP